MIGRTERLVYAVSQTARVGWYFGQYVLAYRLATRLIGGGDAPAPRTRTSAEGRRWLMGEIRRLMELDYRNIEEGRYRMPHDLLVRPGRSMASAARFLRDVPRVTRRRLSEGGAEVFRAPPSGTERLPRYYRQNFHYQTDGYLSDHSARLYDHQVEVLFAGGADAMRRQALVPIYEYFQTRRISGARLADVACGTGRFLTFVMDNYPRLSVTGVDLSVPYLQEARRNLTPWRRSVQLVQGAAEHLPLADESQDIVTSIYLFHELPQKIRQAAAAEFARLLKPGGRLVFVDSLQIGDRPVMDPLLERFPKDFYEPYYADYIKQDLRGLFEGAGLVFRAESTAFLSKVMVLDKPGA